MKAGTTCANSSQWPKRWYLIELAFVALAMSPSSPTVLAADETITVEVREPGRGDVDRTVSGVCDNKNITFRLTGSRNESRER
jgi:hypothetical protein